MELRAALTSLVLMCATSFWKEAEAVQCYECYGCNDPFKESQANVTTCDYACLKIKAARDSVQYVGRGCWDAAENKCAKVNNKGVEANACACTTDKCNDAESHSVQKAMFIVISAILLISRKIFF